MSKRMFCTLTECPTPSGCATGGCHSPIRANAAPISERDPLSTSAVSDRITEYLTLGGLVNPELMEHDKVRDLLIDARRELTDSRSRAERLQEQITFAEKAFAQAIEEANQLREDNERVLLEQVQSWHDIAKNARSLKGVAEQELEAATSRIALLEQDLQTARSRAERVEQELERVREELNRFTQVYGEAP